MLYMNLALTRRCLTGTLDKDWKTWDLSCMAMKLQQWCPFFFTCRQNACEWSFIEDLFFVLLKGCLMSFGTFACVCIMCFRIYPKCCHSQFIYTLSQRLLSGIVEKKHSCSNRWVSCHLYNWRPGENLSLSITLERNVRQGKLRSLCRGVANCPQGTHVHTKKIYNYMD